MSLHDWNNNGRDDLFDSFIDYQIISEEEEEAKNRENDDHHVVGPGSGGYDNYAKGKKGAGCINWVIWLLAAYGILSLFF